MNLSKSVVALAMGSLFISTVCLAQSGIQVAEPAIEKFTTRSLGQTTQWITDRFKSLPGFEQGKYGDKSSFRYAVSFDDCDMTITNTETGYSGKDQKIHGGKRPEIKFAYVKLQDLDVNTFALNKNTNSLGLLLRSLDDKDVFKLLILGNVTPEDNAILKKFTVQGDAVGPDAKTGFEFGGKLINVYRYYSGNSYFRFQDVAVAESMQNAFKQAVTLCQRKAAEEKATAPDKRE
ncbi:MAG: hypothetical protein ABIQ90_12370 [Polaromonas sp.]